MNISQWFVEFIVWNLNAFTYFFQFLPVGKPIDNPTEKTKIVIISPGFTGPLLYRQEKLYLEKKGFQVIVINFSKEMRNLEYENPLAKNLNFGGKING